MSIAKLKHIGLSLLLATVLGLQIIGSAQERIVLTNPVLASAGATEFRVWTLTLRRAHPDIMALVSVAFREATASGFLRDGRAIECRYEGAEADALVIALNKSNLSANSLEKRIVQRCQMDGQLGAGTIAGSVQ